MKKIIKKGGGHHGGAWKVAYADFVTAMMAFFLLMWLLNIASQDQLKGIAEYFDPTIMVPSNSRSGAGGVMGGITVSPDGALSSNMAPLNSPTYSRQIPSKGEGENDSDSDIPDEETDNQDQMENTEEVIGKFVEESPEAVARRKEEERFEGAMEEIKSAIADTPELEELVNNIIVDITPEGLRIQIVDRDGISMFPSGSTQMYERTENLLGKIASIIEKTPNQISVRGHTDGVPYGAGADYTNWELSADRANSSRKVLMAGGLSEEKINNVMGKADKEHLFPDKPRDPRNRRITIVLLRDDVVKMQREMSGADKKPEKTYKKQTDKKPKDSGYNKTDGKVYFP